MAEGTQQHPLKSYFYVWTLLFVFSGISYWVDWYGFPVSYTHLRAHETDSYLV